MNTAERLRQWVERVLSAPAMGLSRWGRLLVWQWRLWGRSFAQLRRHNVGAMSSALSFRAILAMVPALVLGFLVLRSVGIIGDPQQAVRKVLEQAGFHQIHLMDEQTAATAPDQQTQVNVARRLEQLVADVNSKLTLGVLGPVGVVLLIWTSLTLLNTMESSLNRICEAPRSRSFWRRVLTYWSAMTLGPVLLATASYLAHEAGMAAAHLISRLPGTAVTLKLASYASPVVFGIILLMGLYKLMPNATVSLRAALGGAAVAAPLWLLAKWGFGLYVEKVVGRGSLYGTLGLIPLFLLWLNLSWQIVLLGAQLAYTQDNLVRLEMAEQAQRTMLGPADRIAAALAIARRFDAGGGPMPHGRLAEELKLPLESVRQLGRQLESLRVSTPLESDIAAAYALTGPLTKLTLVQLLGLDQPLRPGLDPGLCRTYDRLVDVARRGLRNTSVADVLAESPPG